MDEQTSKKWFFTCVSIIISLLAVLALVMIIADPYFHYHAPLPFLSYRLYEERYTNDGINRHFDYDAIITGTSMAQNFKPSEMDSLFGTTTIKQTFPGAGYQELSQNLERALSRNKNLRTVLWSLDYNGLLREYDWTQYEGYPAYLYDDNALNDVSYLFNKSILYHGTIHNVIMTLAGNGSTTMDEYSSWKKETGLAEILNSYDRKGIDTNVPKDFDEEARQTVIQTITTNIIDVVNLYPDTTFYIFYTPYSIVYWDSMNIRGTIERQIAAEQTATELLLTCPNVKLYSFFDQYEVICNPDCYCDDGHYSSEINSQILSWIAEDTGLITWGNYKERLALQQTFYLTYDYDKIYADYPEFLFP